MPCIGLSQGPKTRSTWDFRGSGPWEAFRDLEDALSWSPRFLKLTTNHITVGHFLQGWPRHSRGAPVSES